MVLKIMMMNSEILQEKQIELFQKLNLFYSTKVRSRLRTQDLHHQIKGIESSTPAAQISQK